MQRLHRELIEAAEATERTHGLAPLWPQQLDARTAAAFCGESPAVFRRKVRAGIYPKATFQRQGSRPMWHRAILEKHLARLHGLGAVEHDEIAELM